MYLDIHTIETIQRWIRMFMGNTNNAIEDFHLHTFTPVHVRSPEKLSGLKDRFFFTGSCFSSYLYQFLNNHFFHSVNSPFGNTYNPFSIAHTLSWIIDAGSIKENEVFSHNGLYRHFAFHTEICTPDKMQFISTANKRIRDAFHFLQKTTVIVITFGTAYAYFYRKTGRVVNNCHTLPGREFERRLLSVDEINSVLIPVLTRCRDLQKELLIILTCSPVRHLRNRPEENTLSKAVLCCAINELLHLPGTYYFPSYEIMLDELRDYRFYAHDLCHPNEKSTCYIMKRFCESCLDQEAKEYLEKVILLRKALMHKPRHPGTDTYRKFLQTQEENLKALCKRYPDMPLPQDINNI